MDKSKVLVATLMLTLLVVVACAPKAAPTTQAPASAPAVVPVPVAAAPASRARVKEAWEEEWEAVVNGAKREGKVVIYSAQAGQVRAALQQGLKSRYGVAPEFITGGSGEMGTKILAERRAGLRLSDVAMVSSQTPIRVLKPAGVLEPLDSVFILPEVTDLKNWLRGERSWIDLSTHTTLAYSAFAISFLAVNTDLVKPSDLESYRDLLKPKWKGQMLFQDPTLGAGAGSKLASVMGNTYGWDFVRELAKQEPLLVRDVRLQAEWVARGKYAIALAPRSEEIFFFRQLGLPIANIEFPKEGFESSATAVVNLLKDAAHPNTARLFLNWLLTKEGQTIFSQASGLPSTRLDVSDEGLMYRRLRPDAKYPRADLEEAILQTEKDRETITQIFAPPRK